MRTVVIALDGVFDTGLTVLLDALGLANKFAISQGSMAPFDVSVVGMRRSVRTAQGFTVPVQPVNPDVTPDWVIVPALATAAPDQLVASLERKDVMRAKAHIQSWRAAGARVAAACIGTFLIADIGLLDGREATTTWWLAPLFRQRYPRVLLDETRMLVPTDMGVTAGAAMGHLDLALWLVKSVSPELASVVSRYLLADLRSMQAPYIIPHHLAQADPLIERFERWARKNLKAGFSLQTASDALSTSPRTLQRRCEAVLGKSPLAYFQDLRIEKARSLLHDGRMDVESIAAEVGYSDGATLRTLLRQKLGRGVRDLRAELL